MQEFNLQLSREVVLHHTGKDLTEDQVFAVKYHIYGIIGRFRKWLYGDNMTTEYLTAHLFERTPDSLKEAFSRIFICY